LSKDVVKRYLPHGVVLVAYLFLCVRFFHFISRYAVNILFDDPWSFDDATLFQPHTLWEMYRWQHGWHRQGLGALLQRLFEPAIHWNGRSEALLLGTVFVGAAVLALLLKVRLYGAVDYSDVIIPLLLLTPLQFETLVFAPNPACSLPLPLIVIYGSCWSIRACHWRYTCVLVVNFLLIYTGFGIFMGPVTPVILALDYRANIRHLGHKYQWGAAAAMAIAIASLASFFVHYRFVGGVECFSPAPRNPVLYPWFVALMFAHAAGLRILTLPLATLVGTFVLVLFLTGLWITGRRLLSPQSHTWPRDAAIAALLAYCAVFSLNAAYARMCLGLMAAAISRYTPYMVLGMFGFYLYALSNHRRNIRVSLVLFLLVFATLSARPLNSQEARILEQVSSGKRMWRDCYLARHDIYECEALTNFRIYPHPDVIPLQEKLDFLERNHLNLYDNSQ